MPFYKKRHYFYFREVFPDLKIFYKFNLRQYVYKHKQTVNVSTAGQHSRYFNIKNGVLSSHFVVRILVNQLYHNIGKYGGQTGHLFP